MEREMALNVIKSINDTARRKKVGLLTLDELMDMSIGGTDNGVVTYTLKKNGVTYIARIGEDIVTEVRVH